MARFQPGQSGNPSGRRKGVFGGRTLALMALDRMLTRRKNLQALSNALEKDLHRNPVLFFKTIIMPLLPREARLELGREGVIEWRSLLGGAEERCQVSPLREDATAGQAGVRCEENADCRVQNAELGEVNRGGAEGAEDGRQENHGDTEARSSGEEG